MIWGTTWIFIKIGLEDLPPITFAAASFFSRFLFFFVIFIQKIPLPETKGDWTSRSNRDFTIFRQLQPCFLERTYFIGTCGRFASDDNRFRTGSGMVHLAERKNHRAKNLCRFSWHNRGCSYFLEQLQIVIFGHLPVAGNLIGAYAAAHASILIKAMAEKCIRRLWFSDRCFAEFCRSLFML